MSAAKPTPAEPAEPAAEREPVLAGQAGRGMLLARIVDGENIGIEIRHVEPTDDGQEVLIILAGAESVLYHVDAPLDVVDKREADAANDRLRAKRRTGRQVQILRQLADLVEVSGLPLPFFLRMDGSLGSLDELRAVAVALGCDIDQPQAGTYRLTHTFGEGDQSRYSAPVELSLSYYDRNG